MAHDLVIKNGMVIDGTGAASFRADVVVDDRRITRIGDASMAEADKVIDATDRIVTPGFIDAHTHLDAQVGWDPEMTSSSMHGITTVLVGNCGVSFAPVSRGNEETLAKIMESVEDISAEAIMHGLPWSWTDYGGYLDAVQELNPALNVVGLVGHAAIRYDAMGDRSIDHHEHPTDAELERMCELVRDSMAAGAVGFSTSRLHGHTVPDGRQMPGTLPDAGVARHQQAVVEGGGQGAIFQVVPEIKSLGEAIVGVARALTRDPGRWHEDT